MCQAWYGTLRYSCGPQTNSYPHGAHIPVWEADNKHTMSGMDKGPEEK